MVNFGPLAAEIVSLVWGTRANFNRFCILASLLHGSQVVSVSQLRGVEQRAPPMFGRATITLGIGPHSSFICVVRVTCSGTFFFLEASVSAPIEPGTSCS